MNRVGASVGAVAVLACAAFIASALSPRTEAKGSAGSQERVAVPVVLTVIDGEIVHRGDG